jgi:hypothetical protein
MMADAASRHSNQMMQAAACLQGTLQQLILTLLAPYSSCPLPVICVFLFGFLLFSGVLRHLAQHCCGNQGAERASCGQWQAHGRVVSDCTADGSWGCDYWVVFWVDVLAMQILVFNMLQTCLDVCVSVAWAAEADTSVIVSCASRSAWQHCFSSSLATAEIVNASAMRVLLLLQHA